MSDECRKAWDDYALSWRVASGDEKRVLYEKCLDRQCTYSDPLVDIRGWDELEEYMLDFHRQIPGGHFVTTYFLAHHGKSICRWEMRNADDATVGNGISYGEYGESGKLTSMTGFFDTPAA